jgi:2-dehydro-3-deoxyphosphogluconate aldolase/(4S)-4-hydroxy-2-oxoglutarate aldolase
MESDLFSWKRFSELPVVGIVRNITMEDLTSLLPLYQEAGLSTLEITMNTQRAEQMIQYAAERYGSQLNIGAGTVCNLQDLEKALQAGARFIVTPITDEQVIRRCRQKAVPVFAGAFTPAEIYKAWELGADMVKIFPATSLGIQYIKDLKGPFNHIRLMPTGGVNIGNCVDFLNAGVEGLGIGGQLFDRARIRSKDWMALSTGFKCLVRKIKSWQMASV